MHGCELKTDPLPPGGDCSTFTVLMSGFVHGTSVVRTIRRDRCNGVIDLPNQGRDLGAVMRPASSQIRCDDLTCIRVGSEVQLPPGPVLWRFPQMTDVNPEPCAIDAQMDRSIRVEPAKSSLQLVP